MRNCRTRSLSQLGTRRRGRQCSRRGTSNRAPKSCYEAPPDEHVEVLRESGDESADAVGLDQPLRNLRAESAVTHMRKPLPMNMV